jgi:Ca2+-binding EF-hand superfamily protein
MGKSQSTMSTDAMKKARKYFEAHEINDVMSIFQNLQADERLLEGKADGSTHAGIDIETFGEYFSYPGVLREQIFKVFDSNKDGLIDREEFMRGLAMCCKGSLIEKLEFCFGMFDLSGDGFIDKLELHKCLASTAFASFALLQAVAVEQGFMKDEDCLQPDQFSKEVDSMVADAFDGSDHNGDNKLSFQEFKRWMIKTPEVSLDLFIGSDYNFNT